MAGPHEVRAARLAERNSARAIVLCLTQSCELKPLDAGGRVRKEQRQDQRRDVEVSLDIANVESSALFDDASSLVRILRVVEEKLANPLPTLGNLPTVDLRAATKPIESPRGKTKEQNVGARGPPLQHRVIHELHADGSL